MTRPPRLKLFDPPGPAENARPAAADEARAAEHAAARAVAERLAAGR